MLAGWILTLSFSACTMQKDTFDSTTWKAQRGASALDNQRGGMVPKLKTSLSEGMPRAEVLRLLGEPDSQRANTDVYELGVSDLGIDEEHYEIGYKDGDVASHRWSRR